MKKKYIVDASVVLKALLNENSKVENEFTELLRKSTKGTVELLSSKLLLLEVANGMRFSSENQEDMLKVFDDFLKLPIKLVGLTKSQIKEGLKLSYKLGSTVYDSSYHVLAKAHGAIFLTCDENYFKRAKMYDDIVYLE